MHYGLLPVLMCSIIVLVLLVCYVLASYLHPICLIVSSFNFQLFFLIDLGLGSQWIVKWSIAGAAFVWLKTRGADTFRTVNRNIRQRKCLPWWCCKMKNQGDTKVIQIHRNPSNNRDTVFHSGLYWQRNQLTDWHYQKPHCQCGWKGRNTVCVYGA